MSLSRDGRVPERLPYVRQLADVIRLVKREERQLVAHRPGARHLLAARRRAEILLGQQIEPGPQSIDDLAMGPVDVFARRIARRFAKRGAASEEVGPRRLERVDE